MKVAVSIPDGVFAEAEQLASDLGTTRSSLYARALSAYLAVRTPDRLAQSWNDVLDQVGAEPDAVTLRAAARVTLRNTDW